MSKTTRDLSPIFEPKSVALIGASNNPLKYGWIILANILANGYKGKVYPINPNEDKIWNLKVYRSLSEVPEEVDLVDIVRPAETVPEHIEECVENNVKSAIVISGGFKETGREGEKLEGEMVKIARKGGMLLVGPNTMGVYSASVSLSALMPPILPKPGEVSLISQSGNIGTNLLAFGSEQGIGFSKFVSSGNEADISTLEYLEYFAEDPSSKVILLYLEGLREGRRFVEVVKRIKEKKPVIIYKAAVSRAGAGAAKSHCGALAGSTKIYEAAIKQSGAIRASTINGMLDLAVGFLYLPLPKGNRVGIVTWGGGYGVVASDSCELAGLDVPPLAPETVKEIDQLLPSYWSRGNPVDLVGLIDREVQPKTLEAVAKTKNIDALIASGFILGRAVGSSIYKLLDRENKGPSKNWTESTTKQIVEVMRNLMDKYQKPIVTVTLTTDPGILKNVLESRVPAYSTLETAAEVLAKMYEYQKNLKK
ncbi:MAG: acetate--CoA ligase family protein [Candidatus Jordarchaeum sp.]|uniref:acetate--CoA ligase family protein n=1 Tax=Candidatus Jordarchaeum sp. TaxID=2823881 RepID=UPI004049DC06